MKGMGSPSSTQTACIGLYHRQDLMASQREALLFQGSRNASNYRKLHCFFIFWAYLFPFQIFVRGIIVVLCCTKCGDGCLKSSWSCKRLFFVGTAARNSSEKSLRPPTALCHCGFPCYIASIWPFGCLKSKCRVSSVEISALFSYSQLESVETTKKKKKHFYSAENLTISRLAFCTLCYL